MASKSIMKNEASIGIEGESGCENERRNGVAKMAA
jgi:hypothetical protein